MQVKKIADSMADCVGNTPLVRLSRLFGPTGVEALAKIEFYNPGGSVKDRAAFRIIQEAEKKGILKKGMTVVEATSGNMGTGLAIACAIKGYKMVAVMPETMSLERRHMLRSLGAEVYLTKVTGEQKGKITIDDYYEITGIAKKIAGERGGFWADQFNNFGNLLAHYEGTGREILDQTDGRLDVFVAAVGSGGTLIGAAKAIKEHNPKIKVIAVEPTSSSVLQGGEPGQHKIQGVGAGFVPPFFDAKFVDGYVSVTDEECRVAAQRLAKEEGIFAGYSSGANIAASLKVSNTMKKGEILVTMINDTGLKYLSTDLFT